MIVKEKKNVKKKYRSNVNAVYTYRKYKFNWNIFMSGPSLDV